MSARFPSGAMGLFRDWTEWTLAPHCACPEALYLLRGRAARKGLPHALPRAEEQPENRTVLFVSPATLESAERVAFGKIVGVAHTDFAVREPFGQSCSPAVVLFGYR